MKLINTELVLADLETIDKRIAKVQKEAKANPKLAGLVAQYIKAKEILDTGEPLWNVGEDFEELN